MATRRVYIRVRRAVRVRTRPLRQTWAGARRTPRTAGAPWHVMAALAAIPPVVGRV